MTFNSSCAFAGVANMLARYGVDTDDRTIAMEMKLPYLFAYEGGAYLAGPMLQRADWFDLYLNPLGFGMEEIELAASQVPKFLKRQKTAMLGLNVKENGKHAVVYTGTLNGKLVFLNNKWEHGPEPEQMALTETELVERLGPAAMVATLVNTDPKTVCLSERMEASIAVIQRNLSDIRWICSRIETIGALRSQMNTLFRPLLLDGITMLELLGESELAQRFTILQHDFLRALRQDETVKIKLGDYLSVEELTAAAEAYLRLIDDARKAAEATCNQAECRRPQPFG